MKILLNSVLISSKLIKRKITLLFAILTMAWLLCHAIVVFIENTYNIDDFKLKLAVVNLDDSENIDTMLEIVLKNKKITDLFDVDIVSQNKASKLLSDREILATIIIPNGFLNSVLNGENFSPEIQINATNIMEKYIISNIATSFSDILCNTQNFVQLTYQNLRENYINTNDKFFEVNIDYIKNVLNYDDIFEQNQLKYVNTLEISLHYSICIVVFIIFLTMPMFFDEINIEKNKEILKFIKIRTNNYIGFYFSRIIVMSLMYFVIFLLINIVLNAGIDVYFCFALLNGAIFMVLLQSNLLNLTKDYVSAVFVNFVVHIFSLILSGGVIPTLFLPQILSKVEFLSPIFIIKSLFSLGYVNFDAKINIFVIALNIVLACALLFNLQKSIKVGEYENF